MKWTKLGSAVVAVLVAFSVTACDSLDELVELEVINQNNPERERALQEAGDIESLISSAFNIAFDGQNDYYSPSFAMSAAADETSCSWGNTGLQQLSSEPREEWPNEPSWRYANVSEDGWYDNYEALSSVYDGLLAIENDREVICNEIDCARAETFAKFVQGYALGFLALMYDSAFIFDETVDLNNDVLELQPYPNVMTAALGYLNQAIDGANNAGWTVEGQWMSVELTAAEFRRIVNSIAARYLSNVARTPAERAAVNWGQVISYIDAGVQADFWMQGDGRSRWQPDLISYGARAGGTWQRADYKTIGWTEISEGTGTGYAGWLGTPVADRMEFLLDVPDLRIMPPGDPQGIGTDFEYRGPSSFRADRGTYHFSHYAHIRYANFTASGYDAPFPFILYQPQQLLKAEGIIRTNGTLGDAATIINNSRVTRGGLPAAAAGDADLLDKMIYEYRIENFLVCGTCAFFTRRGWGPLAPTGPNHHQGLVEGTQIHFAPPGQELEILQKLLYSYGGVGSEGTALSPAGAPAANMNASAIPARMLYAFNGLDDTADKLEYLERNRGKGNAAALLTRH